MSEQIKYILQYQINGKWIDTRFKTTRTIEWNKKPYTSLIMKMLNVFFESRIIRRTTTIKEEVISNG